MRVELDAGAGADADERDNAVRNLRDELLELDVDAVDRPSGQAPEGTRAAEVVALGTTLLVTLGPSALTAVTDVLQGWMARGKDRSVALEMGGDRIELSGATDQERRQLVEAFLARQRDG